jgi:hypothetical protein
MLGYGSHLLGADSGEYHPPVLAILLIGGTQPCPGEGLGGYLGILGIRIRTHLDPVDPITPRIRHTGLDHSGAVGLLNGNLGLNRRSGRISRRSLGRIDGYRILGGCLRGCIYRYWRCLGRSRLIRGLRSRLVRGLGNRLVRGLRNCLVRGLGSRLVRNLGNRLGVPIRRLRLYLAVSRSAIPRLNLITWRTRRLNLRLGLNRSYQNLNRNLNGNRSQHHRRGRRTIDRRHYRDNRRTIRGNSYYRGGDDLNYLRRRHRKHLYRLYRRGSGYGNRSRRNRRGSLRSPGFHCNSIIYSNRNRIFPPGRRFLFSYFRFRFFPNRLRFSYSHNYRFWFWFRLRRRRFLPGNNNRLRFRRRRFRGCRLFGIT